MTRKTHELAMPVGAGDHAQGVGDAPITLVEYGDYECPYCGKAYPIVKRIQERLGDRLRFVFRNFPLAELHPNATAAAEFAEAAALQGRFWEAHDTLFEHQRALNGTNLQRYGRELDLDRAALDEAMRSGGPSKRVRADFMSGVRSGVNGTPTFFINGHRYDGDWGDEEAFVAALSVTDPM
jgi:protein-disulfide isomerase